MKLFVLGNHRQLALAELGISDYQVVKPHRGVIITPNEVTSKLWGGIIKGGYLTTLDKLEYSPIIGVWDRKLGKFLKECEKTRRFKEIESSHTDLEVKKDGIEVVALEEEFSETMKIGVIDWYQPIDFFEEVDFGKPGSGMGIGMMPAKLTTMMVNMGISGLEEGVHTVYDPFAGFGTTGLITHHLGHHFVGSDINNTIIKTNSEWLKTRPWYNDQLYFTTTKHDATTPFEKGFMKNADVIVTEGWLGPIVTKRLMPKVAEHQLMKVGQVYDKFIKQVNNDWKNITVVISVPVYHFGKLEMYDVITPLLLKNTAFKWQKIGEYRREKQIIGRMILKAVK